MNRIKSLLKQLNTGFLLCIYATTNTAEENPTLHRAVEPARANIDITLNGNELVLHFSVPPESLPYILKPDNNINSVVDQLADLKGISTPDKSGLCTHTAYQIHQIEEAIQGYQSFYCDEAEDLSHITLDLFKVLPSLVEADVWLITEQWQTKEIIYSTEPSISIKPEIQL
ncbi:hypothetical protein ACH42_07290 [Endozoicomonas sp. (ex Bugula neritina AB1)]|nr:hypothetical protein ACH42_07290 [Endozoicomonas sp. (ex Bugula neritina AB1)]